MQKASINTLILLIKRKHPTRAIKRAPIPNLQMPKQPFPGLLLPKLHQPIKTAPKQKLSLHHNASRLFDPFNKQRLSDRVFEDGLGEDGVGMAR
jgi:hypothetical protein